MISNNVLLWLVIIIVIGFIYLVYVEIKEHHFPDGIVSNKEDNTKTNNKERYYDVTLENENKLFVNMPDYMKKVEDPQLYDVDDLGCYDNDQLLEDIKGQGNTCKSWSPKVSNAYYLSSDKGDESELETNKNITTKNAITKTVLITGDTPLFI